MCSEHTVSPEYLITLLQPGAIVGTKWKLVNLLGTGSFGVVYKVENVKDKKHYAMKVELADQDNLALSLEAFVLKKIQGSRHACRFYDCGFHEKVHYLVMGLLGRNLNELRRSTRQKRFSLVTTMRLGVQCLEAIRDLHDAGFIHRDVKPANFGIGSLPETRRTIYILDFGTVRQYILKGRVRMPRSTVQYGGTARYSSMGAHYGREMFTYDDVISLLLSMAEMYLGELPWKVTDTVEETLRIKNRVSAEDIFKDMPNGMKKKFEFLQTRRYGDLVDYDGFKNLFEETIAEISAERLYEWEEEASSLKTTTSDSSQDSDGDEEE